MDEQTQGIFDYQEMDNFYQEDFYINPDESISHVFTDVQSEITDASTSSKESTVWKYFYKRPHFAPGHNVCKTCSTKYELTTSVTTLRKHLKLHQLYAPSKKQSTMTRMDSFNRQEQDEHTKYLVQWIICDLQPFSVVDNSYFREFINYFCPRYIVPERHQIKDLIIKRYNARRTKIINDLDQIEGRCSLTADMWTSMNREAYLGITIHYINSNWHLCNFLLDIIPFTTRHTGKNIAQEIVHILDEFNVSDKILALTTDNGSAMVVCGREIANALNTELSSMNFSHYRCAAHVLNLGVKQGLQLVSNSVDKIRGLMIKIKNSTLLCNQLRTFCNIKEITYHKPILDVETRWNSTYYMLKCWEELQPALTLLAADNEDVSVLNTDDDDLIAIKVDNLLLKKNASRQINN
jgi:hypothetical protein